MTIRANPGVRKVKSSGNLSIKNSAAFALLFVFILLTGAIPGSKAQSSPALNPRGAFQAALNTFLANTFRIPNTTINNANTSLAVNSANQLQSVEVVFNDGGVMRLFNNLPPSNPFPPQSTAQIPRVYLTLSGVLSYAKNAQPLTSTQRDQIAKLYAIDRASRRNYGVNVQNLASALTQIKNNSNLDAQTVQLINNTIAFLGNAYNQIANFNGRSPDPDTVYKQVANTLRTLTNISAVDTYSLNTALNILGIGYANYMFNRLPINGTNNPTATNAAALPAFNAAKALSQAQAVPDQVFGNAVSTYLLSIGIQDIPFLRQYQINSADKVQGVEVSLIFNNQTMTVFFNGNFPVTNTTPPQIVFSGDEGARVFARIADNDPATAQRLKTFFVNNPGPRAAYIINLNNLIAGFQVLKTSSNVVVQQIANDTINSLQNAVNGLNASSPIVPDVLDLYQQVGLALDIITVVDNLNTTQLQALDTLNRSTFPIGLVNYFARPVVLSQTS
ncbi:MAG: hypothetical protein AB1489_18700 [Acidobacteriota bacterium]